MSQAQKYLTQWTGQFGVAHELSRRGYVVAHTIGNAPGADLFCQSPAGVHFSVEVKTTSVRGFIIFQKHLVTAPAKSDRFFIVVYVPKDLSNAPQYFVLSSAELRRLYGKQKRIGAKKAALRERPYASFSPGIDYSLFLAGGFEGRWETLPS